MLTHIIPQIAPLAIPKIRSYRTFIEIEKSFERIEKSKNENTIYTKPTTKPFRIPCFLSRVTTSVAKKMDTSFMPIFTGRIALSEISKLLMRNAKARIRASEINIAINIALTYWRICGFSFVFVKLFDITKAPFVFINLMNGGGFYIPLKIN